MMNITKSETDLISRFLNVKNIKELSLFLNLMTDKENAEQSLDLGYINFEELQQINIDPNSNYRSFTIPKKSGGKRYIDAPSDTLKQIQRHISEILNLMFLPHDAAHGFIKEKSIITNAIPHVSKNYVLNIDLKNFFPSVTINRVESVLKKTPFELNEYLLKTISNLTTYKGVLPQGAPSSPLITNIIAYSLDQELEQFAIEKGINFTRYVDDITFSGEEYIYDTFFVYDLTTIISKHNFNINWKKFRLQKYYNRQEVTGIIVNEKLNNNRQFIRKIRAMLHNWKIKGLEECQNQLIKYYSYEKAFLKYDGNIPNFNSVLKGYIMFLGMVRGKEDRIYKNFISNFELLNKNK